MQSLRRKIANLADLQDVHSSSSSQEDRLQQVAAFVQQHTGAVLVDKLETHLHFKVPTEAEPKLTHFFAKIKVRCHVEKHAADGPAVLLTSVQLLFTAADLQ